MGIPDLHSFNALMARELDSYDGLISVLEVGGGNSTQVCHDRIRYSALDICAESLARNDYAEHKLLGDAQSFDYGTRRYDVAVFWNVLEHIEDPARALVRAAAAVKPDGLVVVRGPVLRSLKALVTAHTPHRLHVEFYRKVLGKAEAGTPGHAPYPVAHATAANPEKICALLGQSGCQVIFDQRYVGNQAQRLRQHHPLVYSAYCAASCILQALTLGYLGGLRSEFIIVARKAVVPPAARPYEARRSPRLDAAAQSQ